MVVPGTMDNKSCRETIVTNLFTDGPMNFYSRPNYYMHFKPKHAVNVTKSDNAVLNLNRNEVKEVSETKFLGVTIDNQLYWVPHLNNLVKKLKCCSGQINRISNLIPKDLYQSIFHTLFESRLSYGITVWEGISSAKLRPLFSIHCTKTLH